MGMQNFNNPENDTRVFLPISRREDVGSHNPLTPTRADIESKGGNEDEEW